MFDTMTIYAGNFHRKGYLMLHHLAGVTCTIQAVNLVKNKCHPTTLFLSKSVLDTLHAIKTDSGLI